MLLGVGGDLDRNSVVIFDFISDGRNRDRTFGDLIDDPLVDVVVGEEVDEVGLDFSSVNTLGGWFMGFGLNIQYSEFFLILTETVAVFVPFLTDGEVLNLNLFLIGKLLRVGINGVVSRVLLVVQVGEHVNYKFSKVSKHDLKDSWLTLHHCMMFLEKSVKTIREHEVVVIRG